MAGDDPGQALGNKVDIYNFGIVLWELITGKIPSENMSAVQAAFAVVNRGECPTMPRNCLATLACIITQCWDANSNARPHFSVVVQMLEEAQNEIFKMQGELSFDAYHSTLNQ